MTADEDRGRGKYAGREPDPERMTPEEEAEFSGHDRRCRTEARCLAYLAVDLLDYTEEELAPYQAHLEDAIAQVSLILANMTGE